MGSRGSRMEVAAAGRVRETATWRERSVTRGSEPRSFDLQTLSPEREDAIDAHRDLPRLARRSEASPTG